MPTHLDVEAYREATAATRRPASSPRPSSSEATSAVEETVSKPSLASKPSIQKLVGQIYDTIGNPVDRWAVVATLESMGWRDIDAQKEYNCRDLFALSDDIFRLCKARARKSPSAPTQLNDDQGTLGRFVRYYGRGLLFAMPMVGQVAAILFLGYSLWAWLYFSEAQATVIAVGTILSLIVTGGFVQSIGREGSHYLGAEQGRLAWQSCRHLIRLGTVAVLVIGAGAFLLNLVFPFYPPRLMAVSMMYFVLLSELWLFLSLLYVLERFSSLLAITLLGIAPVYMVMEHTGWGIYAAHGLGLASALLMAAAYSLFWMYRRARNAAPTNTKLPSAPVRFHSLAPYFAYGLLYFVFLLADRLIAWSAPIAEAPSPYLIWFRTDYELGMDAALLSLFLTLAALQYTVHDFSRKLAPLQKALSGLNPAAHNRYFQRFYRRHLALLLGIGGASIALTYAAVLGLVHMDLLPAGRKVFGLPATRFVFWGASFGYLFISIGLMNVLFFFTLARPVFALRAIGPALLTDLAVGFAASRWLGHEYAVLGLAAGGLVFALLSTHYARRFFSRFDYYYYSAY